MSSLAAIARPLVPCGTTQQRSINLNEEQIKEALLSARYALHKYSATECTLDKEVCSSYSMTMEASDKRLYDAHVLYKLDTVEMHECFCIRPTNSCA
ncbi:hypothetical protein TIFTF001_039610 [Ficus carica]|uniref:Uncharacterized protein n=1 Tax=Ficus carica TaxID=3494 RepID=A0AA88JG12_FICCA|nr:hypothetical protein TIFTF001_039610 [Ficus carica]